MTVLAVPLCSPFWNKRNRFKYVPLQLLHLLMNPKYLDSACSTVHNRKISVVWINEWRSQIRCWDSDLHLGVERHRRTLPDSTVLKSGPCIGLSSLRGKQESEPVFARAWKEDKDILVPSMSYRTVSPTIQFWLQIKPPMMVAWAKQKFVSPWFKNWEGERSESGDGSALQSKSLTSKALGTQALPCSDASQDLHAQSHHSYRGQLWVQPAFQLEREIIKKGGGIHQLSLEECPQNCDRHYPTGQKLVKQTHQMQQRLVSTDFILSRVGP